MLASSSRHSLKRAHKNIFPKASQSVWTCKHAISYFSRRSQSAPSFLCRARHSSTLEQQSPNELLPNKPEDLRTTLYRFSSDPTLRDAQRGRLARYNVYFGQLALQGKVIEAFRYAREMKEEGILPDLNTYNLLLQSCALPGLHSEASALMEDMEAMGIKPDRTSFHHVMKAHRFREPYEIWAIYDKMSNLDILPDSVTFSRLIEKYLMSENLEMVLQLMVEQGYRRLVPELTTTQGVVNLTSRMGYPRLALDIAKTFEEGSVRSFDHDVWLNILMASAESLYADGVTHCWSVVVYDLGIIPDEGTCINVLHTAGRHGLPNLATDALRILKHIGVTLEEHHFAPVVASFCVAQQIKEAFGILHLMRSNDIAPVADSTDPIFRAICHDVDVVDETWALLDKMRENGEHVDVAALDVLIKAALKLGDLQRAMGIYKIYPEHRAKPTVGTFNLLLQGCVAAKHRELGDRLLNDMTQRDRVKPNVTTYEQIILLCLTQETYEDAFFYLEEMKGPGSQLRPTLAIYEGLIRRCVRAGDDRYKMARQEMQQCGYHMDNGLKEFIDSGGRSDGEQCKDEIF